MTQIRRRRSRHWPRAALAGGIAVVGVAIGAVAVAVVGGPSLNLGATSPTVVSGPFHLPVVAPGQRCPVSQPASSGQDQPVLLGNGSVRLSVADSAGTVFFEATPGGSWKAIDVLWTADRGVTGDVSIRGARLDGPGELGFGDAADPLRELRLEAGARSETVADRPLLATTPIRVKVAGCYGLEVSVGEQSSVVVFEARPIEDAFAQLERPLELPEVGAGGCRATAITDSVPFITLALGDGPVFFAGGSPVSIAGSRQGGGYSFSKALWVAAPGELGPILVRGGRIDGPGDLRFGDESDPADELRLPIHSYEHTGDQPAGWRIFNDYLRPASIGCYAMQLDTLTETEWIVFEVTS